MANVPARALKSHDPHQSTHQYHTLIWGQHLFTVPIQLAHMADALNALARNEPAVAHALLEPCFLSCNAERSDISQTYSRSSAEALFNSHQGLEACLLLNPLKGRDANWLHLAIEV